MHIKNKTVVIAGYLVILVLLLACMGVSLGSVSAAPGTLLLDNGVVKVVDNNGDSVPVAGSSTFEFTGTLENTNPWTVAGKTLETNASSQIEDGLQAGDLVRVRGTVLDNNTWLAYSIERAEEQPEQPNSTITIIGEVTSVEPWVVNGITLNVTDDTVITGDITPGKIVRVEILLLEDGTWEVLSITLLGETEENAGCATVTARVESVNGNEIKLVGWPAITLGEDVKIENQEGDETTLSPDQEVLVVVCASEGGQFVIKQITILSPDDEGPSTDTGSEKVLVCHKPDKNGGHTLSIAAPAVPAHLAHGDTLGACP